MTSDVAFLAVLGLSALLANLVVVGKPRALRDYIGLASALYAAFALAGLSHLVAAPPLLDESICLLISPPAAAALALAWASASGARARAFVSALLLCLSAVAGPASALLSDPLLAFAPVFASICAILAIGFRVWRKRARAPVQAFLSALSIGAAAAGFMNGGSSGRTAFALFSAAGLLGLSLAANSLLRERRNSGPGNSGPGVEAKAQNALAAWLVARKS
jgi:hypothetical protein